MAQKPPVIFLVYANDKTEQGEYLRNLSKEMHGIRNVLTDAAKQGLCEIIERSSATVSDIVDVFQDPEYNSRIAIFHYAGHANGDALLLETLDEGRSKAYKMGLVNILSRQESLKLVFFNGCSSHEHTDALLAKGVPAAIGTSSPINDDIATQLSIRFYKGLGMGASIEKSWISSVDETNISSDTSDENTRGLSWSGKSDTKDKFPWALKFNEHAKDLRNWNLPETVGSALFGLPELPAQQLPPSPFPNLNAYDKSYAEIFFGRSRYIRSLYQLVTDKQAPPVILLYGQSGVGKTSLIEAGLAPRMAKTFEVILLKHNESLTLYNTLYHELLQRCGFSGVTQATQKPQVIDNTLVASLEQIASSMDAEMQPELVKLITKVKEKYSQSSIAGEQASVPANVAEAWILAEQIVKKPLLIVLDQVDEAYTKPNPNPSEEINELFYNLKKVFETPEQMPAGKIILSYRQEYHADIEEYCSNNKVTRSRLLLDSLAKNDILTIFHDLTDNTRLQSAYNLTIQDNLGEQIAVEYGKVTNESPISPFLQMTLHKMWTTVTERNPGKPVFSVALYNEIEGECVVIQQFLQRQLEAIEKKIPDTKIHASGLALDILFLHCTKNNTAGACTEKEIMERYPYAQKVAMSILMYCKEFLLLIASSENSNTTILAHDTLALEVGKAYNNSTKPLQQAYRLLNANSVATDNGEQMHLLDAYGISMIELAMPYLRKLTDKENKLITQSKKDLRERARNKKAVSYITTIVAVIAIAAAAVIFYSLEVSKIHEKQAMMSRQAAESRALLNTDNTLSLLAAAEGYAEGGTEHAISPIKEAITTSFYTAIDSNRPFYRNIVVSPYAFLGVVFNAHYGLFVPFPQDSSAIMYDSLGKERATLHAKKRRRVQNFSLLQNAELTSDEIHILGLGSDSVVRMWDMTGKNVYESDTSKPVSILVSGRVKNMFLLLSGDSVEVHYNLSKKPANTFKLPKKCHKMVCSPDGSRLIVTYAHGETEIISLGNEEIKPKPLEYDGGHIISALYSHQGRFIVTAYSDSVCILWDSSGNKLHQFPRLPTEIKGVIFHPSDSVLLIHSGHDGYLYSTWNYAKLPIEPHHSDLVTFVRFSPDGTKVITGSSDRMGQVWSMTGIPIPLLGHVNDITCGFFSENEKIVYTTSLDGTVKAWNLETYHSPSLNTDATAISNIAIHPSGKHLCTIGQDSMLKVWALNPNDQTVEYAAHKKFQSALFMPVFSRTGTKILCITSRNTAITWDWQTQNAPVIMKGHTDTIVAAGFIGMDTVVTISVDSSIRFWDNSGNCFKRDTTNEFCTLNISANGNRVAVGTGNGFIYLFDRTAKKIATLSGHKKDAAIVCADLSADGKKLVTAGEDNMVIIWDLENSTHVTLDRIAEAAYYKLRINSVRFSDDNNYIVTAASDRTARIWRMNGQLQATLYGHVGNVTDAMFTAGNSVVTASDDGTIRYWQLNGSELAHLCCQKAGRGRLAIDSSGEKIFSLSEDGVVRTWLTPMGVFTWVKNQSFYKYFNEFRNKYR